MVADLLRLRLALWRGAFRRDAWRVVAAVVGTLWGLWMVGAGVVALVVLRGQGVETAATAVVLGGSAVVIGWALVPLVAFGLDPSLDPSRFATLSVPVRDLVVGLLLAGLLGVPGLLTALLALATVVTWSRGAGVALLALVAALVGLATAMAASRLVAALAAGALGSRRAREAATGAITLLLVLLGPAVLGVESLLQDAGGVRRAAVVLGWTPAGLAWAAPADAARGAWGLAAARLLLSLVALALVLLAWAAVLRRQLTAPRAAGGGRARARDGGADVLDRLPSGPRWAVAVRCLRYWRRDPRYGLAAGTSVLVPAALALVAWTGDMPAGVLQASGLVLALLVGISLHNDVAADGTAFWTHVATGVRGLDDRWGRTVACLVWAAPLVALVTVVTTVVPGDGRRLPGLLAGALGLLAAGLAVSAVASAVRPYPVQAAGENPFSQPSGAAVPAAVAQALCSSATVLLALPALVLGLLGALWLPWLGWVALAVAVVLGGVELQVGVVQGGRLLDRRAPELLAAVRRDR